MAPPIQIFWAGADPAVDWVLGVLLLRLLMLRPPRKIARIFRAFAASFLLLLVSDLAAAYLSLQTDLRPGTLIDAGWVVASLAIAVASRTADPQDSSRPSAWRERRWHRLETLLPVVFTYAVVGFTVLDWRFSGRLDWGGLGVAAALPSAVRPAGRHRRQRNAPVCRRRERLHRSSFYPEADGACRITPALRRRRRSPLGEPVNLPISGRRRPCDRLLTKLTEGWEARCPSVGGMAPVYLTLLIPVHDERRLNRSW
jgi:hypothetical protein